LRLGAWLAVAADGEWFGASDYQPAS